MRAEVMRYHLRTNGIGERSGSLPGDDGAGVGQNLHTRSPEDSERQTSTTAPTAEGEHASEGTSATMASASGTRPREAQRLPPQLPPTQRPSQPQPRLQTPESLPQQQQQQQQQQHHHEQQQQQQQPSEQPSSAPHQLLPVPTRSAFRQRFRGQLHRVVWPGYGPPATPLDLRCRRRRARPPPSTRESAGRGRRAPPATRGSAGPGRRALREVVLRRGSQRQSPTAPLPVIRRPRSSPTPPPREEDLPLDLSCHRR